MKVYAAQDLQLTDHDFKDIVDTGRTGTLPSENDLTKHGETFASVIDRCGIATFTFDRNTGLFYAVDVKGRQFAEGKTVRDLLDSL